MAFIIFSFVANYIGDVLQYKYHMVNWHNKDILWENIPNKHIFFEKINIFFFCCIFCFMVTSSSLSLHGAIFVAW